MNISRRHLLLAATGSALAASAPLAWAQQGDYPAGPVRIVVGYAPGGAADIAARMLAEWMGQRLGQPFVVENRPGASGTVAANYVSKTPADGRTLFYGPGFGMTMGSGSSRVEYKPEVLFEPVSLMLELPMVLVTSPSVPARSLQELMALAKSKPGELNYASYGKGTTSHLASESLKKEGGLRVEHIVYKGSAPAIMALRAGDVQMMFDTVTSAAPHIKAGALRGLAVTSQRRLDMIPDVPTMHEAGLPSMRMSSWMGLFAPRGTPAPTVQRLSREVAAYLESPAARQRIAGMGSLPQHRDPERFREHIVTETTRIERLIAEARIDLE